MSLEQESNFDASSDERMALLRERYEYAMEELARIRGEFDLAGITKDGKQCSRIVFMNGFTAVKPLQEIDDKTFIYPDRLEIIFEDRYDTKTAVLSPYDCEEQCEEYLEILKRIERGVRGRQLGPEREIKLMQFFDERRRGIHNRAADRIVESLRRNGITIDQRNAKKFFEALYFICQHEQKQKLYYGEEFDDIDTEELKKSIREATGIDVTISRLVHGFHEGHPQRQYNIELAGENVNLKMDKIKQLIDTAILKERKSKKL